MPSNEPRSRPPLFERLADALEESIEFTRGQADLRTNEIPQPRDDETLNDDEPEIH